MCTSDAEKGRDDSFAIAECTKLFLLALGWFFPLQSLSLSHTHKSFLQDVVGIKLGLPMWDHTNRWLVILQQ